MTSRPTAIVYVDGFNLYRRRLEGNPHLKWLDLTAMCRAALPRHEIVLVRYFTAMLKPLPDNPHAPVRQQMYLRALGTDPLVSTHLGTFRADKRFMVALPLEADPETGRYRKVAVRKIEEKGSDVSLAAHMIADAHAGRADLYVLLSNDSDQVGTLNLMKGLGFDIGVIFPMASSKESKALVHTAPNVRVNLSHEVLAASQFPVVLRDMNGTFHRPPAWSEKTEGPDV